MHPNALTGLMFGLPSERMTLLQRRLAALRAENARRWPCDHCDLAILPEQMDRHVAICHRHDLDLARRLRAA